MSQQTNQQVIDRAAEIIAQNSAISVPVGSEPFCVLALIDEDGSPTVSALTAAKTDGIREMTFGTGLQSNKVRRIRQNSRASVCFCGHTFNITLVGDIEVVTDPDVKRDSWYEGMSQHFSGPDDPNYCVLRFHTERYNLFVDWQEVVGVL